MYLSGDFPREMLTERKSRPENTIEALEQERRALAAPLEERTLTDEDAQSLEDFAREVQRAFAVLDDDDFKARRAMVGQLDLRVTVAIEDEQRVAYVSSPVLGESGGPSFVSTAIRWRMWQEDIKPRRSRSSGL